MIKGKVINMNPTSTRFFRLGIKHYEKGEIELAIQRLRRAVELDNGNIEIKFNLAGLLAQIGDFESSNKILLDLIHSNPDFHDSLFGLGCNFFEMGKLKDAKHFLRQYLNMSQNNAEFKEAAEELIDFIESQQEFEKEQKELEKLTKLLERGNFLLENGRFEDAIKYFKLILSKDETVFAARNNLSLAYFYMGQTEKAMKEALKVIEVDKYNVYANCNLAVFYNATGKFKEVKKQLRLISELRTYETKDKIKVLDTLIKLNRHDMITEKAAELFELTNEPYFGHIEAISLYNRRKYVRARKLWQNLKQNFDLPDIRVDYFLKKIDEVMSTFQKDEISYYETGFRPSNFVLEEEFKKQILKQVEGYFNNAFEENRERIMEIIRKKVELTNKDEERILELLIRLPLEKKRLNHQVIAAGVYYVYIKYFKKEKITQSKITRLFEISQPNLSKWFNEYKNLLLGLEV